MTFKPKSKEYYDSLMERTRAAAAIRSRRAAQGAETTRMEAWVPKVGERVRITAQKRMHANREGRITEHLPGDHCPWVVEFEDDSGGWARFDADELEVVEPTPSPAPAIETKDAAPAIEAARERVCQAALAHRKTRWAGLKVDDLTASESKELLEAVDALAALLPPPPTPDQVRELVEAARPLLALKLVHGKPGEHDFFWVTPQEMDRLRSALAAMEART